MKRSHNKVIDNAKWLIGIKILQSVLSLIITMFSARFLGPSNYGVINYVASLVTFISPLMYLGFSSILVHELVVNEDKEGEILGTAVLANLISSLFCILGLVSFVSIVNKGEQETLIVTILYSTLLIVQALEGLRYWFQAHLLSKYTSIISFFAYSVIALYKMFLLINNKSIYWFAVSNSFDIMIIAILQYIIFKRKCDCRLSCSFSTFKRMFNKSKYYIVSGIMLSIFSRTDKVMLKIMVDNQSVGFYTAAVTCAGMTSFVFSAVIDSLTPVLYEAKQKSNQEFESKVKLLFSIVIFGAFLQSIAFTVFAKYIVYIIYGKEFFPTIKALQIIVWYTMFSYIGAVRNRWILAEGKQKLLLWIDTSGAIFNVVLNYLLIPKWGINGAAFASLLTQLFTNVIVTSCVKPIRPVINLMFESLNPKYIIMKFKSYFVGI